MRSDLNWMFLIIFGIILVGCQNAVDVNSPSDSQGSVQKIDKKVSQEAKHNFDIDLLESDWYVRGHGYWKTHSKYGPAPYDPTWYKPERFGEDTEFFLSGKSYYQVISTNPVGGNVYYILSREYISLRLNTRTGAPVPPEVMNAFNDANGLFAIYTPEDIRSLQGNDPLRKQFLNLAAIIGAFNEGQ